MSKISIIKWVTYWFSIVHVFKVQLINKRVSKSVVCTYSFRFFPYCT